MILKRHSRTEQIASLITNELPQPLVEEIVPSLMQLGDAYP
jgi:hypothetical protein